MAALPLFSEGFHDEEWCLFRNDCASDFFQTDLLHAFLRVFLETDNATGNVPACAVEVVVAPRQERSPVVIFDEQVHVDERSYAADEQKQLFGKILPCYYVSF